MTQTVAGQHGLDEAAVIRLVALAGPADGPELMRCLIADIGRASAGMTAGLVAHDCAAMRRHSHVLMAIAGTIGAPQVYVLAKHLNQCAKDNECVSAEPYAIELMADLDGLIVHLQQMSGEFGMNR